jgi:hypothetical protein
MLASTHLFPIRQSLKLIADGGDMWDDKANTRLKRMQHHYRECFAALATNSQLAKREVKGANFCSLTNRPEYLASAYATARADLVSSIHQRTRLKINTQQKKGGNRYVFSGKVGERKRANGELFEEDSTTHPDQQQSIMGKQHSEETIKLVMERHEYISNACKDEREREQLNRLRHEAEKQDNQFCATQIKIKMEEFKTKFNKTRALNKTQQRPRGVETTPFMLNKVPFGKMLLIRDTENLKLELSHRGLSTEGTWTECKNRLMDHEGDRKYFKILSSATFPWHNT